MLLFKKKQGSGPESYDPLPRELRALTARLIAVANRSEPHTQSNGQLENTNAGEVRVDRELVAAQSELLRTIQGAIARGMSVAEIRHDVIDPAVESSVIEDTA